MCVSVCVCVYVLEYRLMSTLLFAYINIKLLISTKLAIGLMSRVLADGLGDQSSIPGQVIPKTQKMVLDA